MIVTLHAPTDPCLDVVLEIPCLAARSRVDQCVASAGAELGPVRKTEPKFTATTGAGAVPPTVTFRLLTVPR